MHRLTSAIARIGLGLMIVCATLVSTGSSASASGEKYVQLASGDSHTCAVLVSGSVKCWGYNGQGQLGLGYTSDSVSSPTLVPDLTDVRTLVLGIHHSCVVLISNSVKCWGYNIYGQLGLGYKGDSVSSPTLVPGLTNVRSLVLGGYHSCAVLVDGSVKCWGENYQGQVGLGSMVETVLTPSVVPGLTDVQSLDLGSHHSCAVLVSGSMKCWGYNVYGQLGLGYSNHSLSSPTLVDGVTDVQSLVLGAFDTCVVLASASVKCWGNNDYGQLGLGRSGGFVSSPSTVPGLVDVQSLVLGVQHTCAVLVSGSVMCWGYNDFGQLGLGYTNQSESSPNLVPGLSGVNSLVAGAMHTCAVSDAGSAKCWGYNYYGQLGLGFASISAPYGLTSPTAVPGVSMQSCLIAAFCSFIIRSTNAGGVGQGDQLWFESFHDGIDYKVEHMAVGTTSNRTYRVAWRDGSPAAGVKVKFVAGMGSSGSNAHVTVGSVAASVPIGGPGYYGDDQLLVEGVTDANGDVSFSLESTDTNVDQYRFTWTLAYVTSKWKDAIDITSIVFDPPSIAPTWTPSISGAIAGNARATLKIAPPVLINDRTLSGYDYSINNGSTWSHFASVDGPFVITGLTNATAYQVKVRAVNSAGAGDASAAVTVTPTNLVPAVPTISSVTAGNQMAEVTVAQATGVTAQSVTGYQYNINGSLTWASCVITGQACRVTGLPNGAKATIKVRAVNSNGVSLASAKSYVTPVTTSQSPTINTITPSVGALTVAFTAPVDNGGSKVLRYEYSVDGGSWVNPSKPIAKSPFTVSGLANATSYSVRVRAVTAVGNGEVSASVSATTPAVVAGAPSITTALAGKTSITVNFTAPTNNGGAAVTNYAFTVDGRTWTTLSPASANTQIVISGLTAYKAYTVKLRAINSAGLGAISASQSLRTLK